MERKNAWKTYSEEDISKLNAISAEYVKFLDNGKTERECVAQTVEMAKAKGYRDLNTVIANGEKLNPGDCVYSDFMGKALMLFKIGKQPIFKGLNIVGAHIDSPRIDLKQNPLYEDTDFAYLDTHYYGGIKKYQWVAMPLAMHGVVAKKDGTLVNIVIGEDPSDPVIGISDLLPHLSRDQMSKKGSVVIEGEELNIIIGSKPLNDEEKEPVKAAVLALLKEKYDIEEEDFLSAELCAVPAFKARRLRRWISALTAASSALTATMTAFAHMLPSMRSSALTKRPNTPAAACLPTRKKSAPSAQPVCTANISKTLLQSL